ncbi:MAG: peptidylprolyl isomerase [Planctomycetota bacterium]
MRHITRWFSLLSILGMGCASVDFPGQPSPGELGRSMSIDEPTPITARGQRADDGPVTPVATAPPPPPTPSGPTSVNIPPPPPGAGPSQPAPVQQASLKVNRSARATVRAWVNGRPIFDDEVILELEMRNPAALRETSTDKITKAYNDTLTTIIELEIAYQDAVKKLEKGNPRALEKLKEHVEREFEKQSRTIRKSVPDDKFAEIAPTFRRQLERQFIGMEYIRSRVFPAVEQVGYLQIKDYYDTHLNEFQKVESVKWQHIFVAVSPKNPTLAAAKTFANSLADRIRSAAPGKQEAEFEAMAVHDDGDSKTRNGLGLGSLKGGIQPAELEKYLFEMKDGQLGPVVEVSTGVHIFRVITRDVGGQTALNDTVQSQIRNKIRNQIFDREFKRFVRELKARAVVEIERGV